MKKYIANIITTLRIISSIALLFFSLQSPIFYIIYLFCGFSDMIDGTIARKLNIVSTFGSKLDTIADFIFMLICSIKILPMINISIFLWVWIVIIAILKINNIILGFICTKKIVDYHTILNKVTGLLLFLLPLTFEFIKLVYSLMFVCIVATLAAVQECYYIIKSNNK